MTKGCWSIAILVGVALAACAPAAGLQGADAGQAAALDQPAANLQEATVLSASPSEPLAPEIQNETWLNSRRLTAADLKGKVVLIDFWTFG